jgi:hypothetical protein
MPESDPRRVDGVLLNHLTEIFPPSTLKSTG